MEKTAIVAPNGIVHCLLGKLRVMVNVQTVLEQNRHVRKRMLTLVRKTSIFTTAAPSSAVVQRYFRGKSK